jgi:hypothetical protein
VTPVASFLGSPTNVDNPCSGKCSHGFVHSESKTDNFKAVPAASLSFCLTIQKQFFDPGANTTSPSLLGWGMSVTDPSGVTNHFTTDAVAGQVTACQFSGGTYTVFEDSSGPVPTGFGYSAGGTFAIPYQVFLNGVQQPLGSVTFTWNSAQPVTVVFVNQLVCAG